MNPRRARPKADSAGDYSVDFDRLSAEVSPDQLAHAIGAIKTPNGYHCPNTAGHSNNDQSPSLSINRKDGRTVAFCHGCDLKGTPVQVASVVWRLSAADAGKRLAQTLDLPAHTENGRGEFVEAYEYTDEEGRHLFEVCRFAHPKRFKQRIRQPGGACSWSTKGVRRVLYRLPKVLDAIKNEQLVYIVEGEKDVHGLEDLRLVATTCPMGAGKWRPEYTECLAGARVVILPDNDEQGRKHAREIATALQGVAAEIRVLELPDLNEKGDVSDWIDQGGSETKLESLVSGTELWPGSAAPLSPVLGPEALTSTVHSTGVKIDDFYAFLPDHKYIFAPAMALWPAASVNATLGKIQVGDEWIPAARWLDRNRPIMQWTWAPGEPTVITNRLIANGGWIPTPGASCYNLYRPPSIELGDPLKAKTWVEHVHRVYPDSADHIIGWLAHRVQKPSVKINHALVLQGAQGTGKDTIIEGAIPAIGQWNVSEASPTQILGRFNGFAKSVVLRVSESSDLGRYDRYRFYEHLKTLIAAPPHVLLIDEKNIKEYAIPNVCGVIITTNHLDGIFLPPDDRRHYVARTELTREDFDSEYFGQLYRWYHEEGGYEHVAAYLTGVDLSEFNPKKPPPQTLAFRKLVDAGRAPEDAELSDILDKLGRPKVVTLRRIANLAEPDFSEWLKDRRNSRQIPHRMEAVGYEPVRNESVKDGLWKFSSGRRAIYALRELSTKTQVTAARELVEQSKQPRLAPRSTSPLKHAGEEHEPSF